MTTKPSDRDWATYWANARPPRISVGQSTKLMDHVDYKLAETTEDRESIYRMRYRAFLDEGAISPNAQGMISDRFDDLPSSWIFGVYVRDTLVSSIRVTVASEASRTSPSYDVFEDILAPMIDQGMTIVDPTFFVADPDQARRFPALPYLTIRLCYVACAHFGADLLLATVRAEHRAFYRKVFLHAPLAGPRMFPGLIKPLVLMASNFGSVRDRVLTKYPYLHSSLFERRMLFQKDSAEFITAKKSLADLKSYIRSVWGDSDALPLALKILDRITISPADEKEVLDFPVLCRLTGKNQPDSELLTAISILTTSKHPALRACLRARADDGREYDVSRDVLDEAIDFASSERTDPAATEAFNSFAAGVILYFAPTEIFESSSPEFAAAV